MVNVYLSVGQPRLQRLFSGIRAVLIIILIYPAIKWLGLTGAATVVFFSTAISYLFQVLRMRKLTGLDTLQYVWIFIHGLVIALIVVVVWFLTYNIFSRNPISNLIYGLIGCAIIYSIMGALYLKHGEIKKFIIRKEAI